jgi:hypothetical protein
MCAVVLEQECDAGEGADSGATASLVPARLARPDAAFALGKGLTMSAPTPAISTEVEAVLRKVQLGR